jgi:diamine N-acetyltransferase
MEITIRRVLPGDEAVLSTIAKKTFYDAFTGTCTEDDMQQFLEQHFNEVQLAKEISTPGDYCFFAEVEGQPAGYIRFMEDYSGFTEMKQWKALELKRIYVLKEYHGRGVAQQLMELYLQYAIENGYKALWLGVWEHNKQAQKFYEKYGFVNSGHPHNFPIGSTPQTDFWFWKFL